MIHTRGPSAYSESVRFCVNARRVVRWPENSVRAQIFFDFLK
jgi:hypothetical protein